MSILSRIPPYTVPWLILAVVVVALLRAGYDSFLSPLAKLPSIHWSARWTRCHILYTKYFYSVRHAHYSAHLNSRSGACGFRPVVRTGPNEVSIMTTDGIQTVFGGDFDRSAWYDVFSNFGLVTSMSIFWASHDNYFTDAKTCSLLALGRPMQNSGAYSLLLIRKPPSRIFRCKTSLNHGQ